jgi:hypothetical protein
MTSFLFNCIISSLEINKGDNPYMNTNVKLPKKIVRILEDLQEQGLTKLEILNHESLKKYMVHYEELIMRGLLDGFEEKRTHQNTLEISVWAEEYERKDGEIVVERYNVKLKPFDNAICSITRKTQKKAFEKIHSIIQGR